MKSNRRGFFQSIAAALCLLKASASAAKAAGNPEGLLGRLLAECTPGLPVNISGWRVMWTGWKLSATSIDECGQWVAFPAKRNGEIDQKRKCWYVSSPGSFGTINRGDVFNLDARYPQVTGFDLMESSCDKGAIQSAERSVSCKLLLEMLQAGGIPEWERMSAETKFYRDPCRLIKEVTGHGLDEYPVNRKAVDAALKFRRDTLGFGEAQHRWWGEA